MPFDELTYDMKPESMRRGGAVADQDRCQWPSTRGACRNPWSVARSDTDRTPVCWTHTLLVRPRRQR